ncbi:MAG: GspH/FimT family pseudopilin [Sedimentisphaerales bacterium]
MRKNGQYALPAFTLVEMIIVLVVIGIMAAVAVPLYTSAAGVQLKTAADMVACDLEYAKSMAMSTGKKYFVVFDASTESYRIFKDSVAGQPIPHPVHIGVNYIVSFAGDSRLNKVNIVNTTFGSNTVRFDYLGSPDNGGSVRLSAGGNILTVKVEPVTGYVSIE